MNIIDCHCHVYPDAIAPKAVEGIKSFYELEIDPVLYTRGTVNNMKLLEDDLGINHQIIFSVATKPSQVKSINEFISREVLQSKGTLTGLGTVHPDSEKIEEDINYAVSLGLKGIKLHPDFQQFRIDDNRAMKIYECCEGKLPILMHCGDSRFDFSNPNRMAPVLEKFKDLTVIGAHLGGWSVWEDAVNTLTEYKNFYVDCSSSVGYIGKRRVLEIIRAFTADKVLFGTDYPMWTPSIELDNILTLGLTDAELEKILYINAQKLFDIKN